MGKIILFQPTENPYITWRAEWMDQYESPWGIFNKFMFANAVKTKDVLELFGTEHVRSLKRKESSFVRDLYSLNGFDENLLRYWLGSDIKALNESNLKKCIDMFNERFSHRVFLQDKLYFCLKCLEIGFHSIFHQIKFIRKCPYHGDTLQHKCPSCGCDYLYDLREVNFTKPFQCICSHNYLYQSHQKLFYQLWNRSHTLTFVRNTSIDRWFNLNQYQLFKLKKAHFPVEAKNYEHTDLLLICSGNLDTNTLLIKSTKNHSRTKSQLEKKFQGKEQSQYKVRREIYLYKEIYQSSLHCIKSVAKHLRKTVLAKHKTCIERFVGLAQEDEICPYAYAYSHWLKSIYELEHYWHVHSHWGIPQKKYRYTRLEFASKQDSEYLYDLFEFWEEQFEDITLIPWETTSYLINRVMMHLVMNHFNNWLYLSQRLIERDFIDLKRVPFNYLDRLPFFVVIMTDGNEPLEFHWKTDNILKEKLKNDPPKCPFNTLKKRRNYRFESVNYLDPRKYECGEYFYEKIEFR